jgi:hypothetical protein
VFPLCFSRPFQLRPTRFDVRKLDGLSTLVENAFRGADSGDAGTFGSTMIFPSVETAALDICCTRARTWWKAPPARGGT